MVLFEKLTVFILFFCRPFLLIVDFNNVLYEILEMYTNYLLVETILFEFNVDDTFYSMMICGDVTVAVCCWKFCQVKVFWNIFWI